MAASTSHALHPTPAQIAHALAGAMPAELSKSPLVGILGVIMGAGIVTLTGRMITLGLADLKGHVGISFDDGAWIGSAFNIALMFIGPFTVYVGALMGPRRVLLYAGGVFTLICIFLPLVHSYSLLIFALAVAGLTSGTFYPLTLTFALRNIPVRFGVAFMGHFIAQREKLHSNLLGLHVQGGNWITDGSLRMLTAGLYSKSSGLTAAAGRAAALTQARLRLQAYTLTFIDGFYLLAWACVAALILIALMEKSPLSYGELDAG